MIEAMKQALEALEYIHTETSQDEDELIHPAITALRQAILEAEKQEPVAWMHTVVANDGEPDHALSFATDNFPLQGVGGFKSVQVQPLYTHPPKTTWVNVECPLCGDMAVAETHPNLPKREWVGLTDEDLSVCDTDGVILARYWETKLKEKNT